MARHGRNLKEGSMTVEAAYLLPLAVFLTAILIFYCFYEHDRVWFTSAACETALVGTRRRESGEEAEKLASVRAAELIEAQPFPVMSPSSEIEGDKRRMTVSFESEGKTAFSRSFPYRTKVSIKQSDPVGAVRTARIARVIINGG
ncbi:MAG: pilus assembly protein [Lachnospiraceae bacterium]|nr:pilus assembly protein [Lachnospiraceae bacterium]